MTIIVAHGQIVTALGDRQQTWQGLCQGRTGLRPLQPPGFHDPWPVALCALDGELGSPRRLASLLEALLATVPALPARTPVICATTKAAPDELLAGAPDLVAQAPHLAALLRRRLAWAGEVETVSAACASGTLAIMQAAMRLEAGECQAVLVVGLDLVSRFVLAGFASLQALSASGCRPFDARRDGLSLGEGGGWLLLATLEGAGELGLAPSARLAGWGTACDATHITAPCRYGSGLIAALQQATRQGRLPVGAINAHGTGTLYNDAMELTAFTHQWQSPPPVYSVKGALGHCLGGAGVIESVLCLDSLASGHIPPTTGFRAGADSMVPISGTACQPLLAPSILTCNSGFGGINAAILFEAYP